MKFAISSTTKTYDQLLETYPCLDRYNFELELVPHIHKVLNRIQDENGQPILFQRDTYHTRMEAYVEVEDLESLRELILDLGSEIVMTKNEYCYSGLEIEIYDGYRE